MSYLYGVVSVLVIESIVLMIATAWLKKKHHPSGWCNTKGEKTP